jgi:hypothetical protein
MLLKVNLCSLGLSLCSEELRKFSDTDDDNENENLDKVAIKARISSKQYTKTQLIFFQEIALLL